jgi:phosphomannomutase
MLRGDELGALLAEDALRRKVHGTYACSIVSSSLLSVMAGESGQPFTYTLTGFKWIGRVPGLAFGYEEALGYCVEDAGRCGASLRHRTKAQVLSRGASPAAAQHRPAIGAGGSPLHAAKTPG